MRILSVNVGSSRPVSIKHKQVQTGIYKVPANGAVQVGKFGLQGDVLVEPRKMGLEHHAVYAYPFEHYAYWQQELQREEPFVMGQFGENLTVTGLLEEEVRIGDIFRFGNTVLQVAQPRIPCAKLNERMGLRFAPMFLASRKVGYYLRVLQVGTIATNDTIELIERDMNSPTMEEFVRVSQYEYWDAQGLKHLLQARDLMPAWREIIEDKLKRTETAVGGWQGLREFEVARCDPECADTVSLYLRCARGRPLAPFHGGQVLTVVLGGRSASEQQRRAYALSGNPQDLSTYRITVRRQLAPQDSLPDGIVSSYLVAMQPGDRILCTAPMGAVMQSQKTGHDDLVPLLLSEGLGLAPTIGLLYEFEARKFPRVLLLHAAGNFEPQGLLREARAMVLRNPGWQMVETTAGEIDVARVVQYVSLEQADVHIAGTRDFTHRLSHELKAAGLSSAALKQQGFG